MTGALAFERAEDVPHAWWTFDGDDPRRTLAWASAHRWDGDGSGFVATGGDSPVVAAVRRQTGRGGWSRMNAVDVCAGVGRDVGPDDVLLDRARAELPCQLNLALAGYTTPVWSADGSDLTGFVRAVSDLAEREGRQVAALHLDAGSGLLLALRQQGWAVGVTDLYPVITGFGGCFDDYLDGLPSKKRVNIRREIRRLADEGGSAEIVRGMDIAPLHDRIAALEAESDRRHGMPVPVPALRAMNERLLAAFGTDMAVALVRDGQGEIVATCTLLHAGGRLLPRMVGYLEERARRFAAYFHVAYYLPLRHAWQVGARELLLGTGSLRPKLYRGARLRPLWSAVPPGGGAVATLLARTHDALTARADELGHPVRNPS
jgi:hypothetical protein